jgi:hypothetical protein
MGYHKGNPFWKTQKKQTQMGGMAKVRCEHAYYDDEGAF